MTAERLTLRQFVQRIKKQSDSDLSALQLDSRRVQPGDVFVAVPGRHSDGRQYIDQALHAGAQVVLSHVSKAQPESAKSDAADIADAADHQTWVDFTQVNTVFHIHNLQTILGELAHIWYGQPSDQLTVIAITGTNGKTSCSQWLAQALRHLGYRAGAIGTLGVTDVAGHQHAGALTTPDVITLHQQLALFVRQQAQYVVMEASSIGLDQGRLDGVRIKWAGFTNLTHDHLDYHGDMTQYAQAKALLFKRQELLGAAINQDDPYGSQMKAVCHAPVLSYGLGHAMVCAQGIEQIHQGTRFDLKIDSHNTPIQVPFFGDYNVSNVLCVASLLHLLGQPINKIAQALNALSPVSGRLEPVLWDSTGPLVLVDYAHTPDALTHVLQTTRTLAQQRSGQLICVVGCGGDRDVTKRPLMGATASQLADQLILTSDNPRSESPEHIIEQMRQGIAHDVMQTTGKVRMYLKRDLAILLAILKAQPQDVVVIAGKGHETGQEVEGVTYPFDDRQWARLGLTMRQAPHYETDSRALQTGAVFIAIAGDRFDGHDFLKQVQQQGACVAIVNQINHTIDLPQIEVGNTRQALLTMGQAWRACFTIPIIGVTGSNGKTTTKEMIAAMLATAWGPTQRLATQGNLNNDLGVPLTLLLLRPHHQVAVIEMGMNHPGEIAVIAQCAQPTVGLVLNAQREHQEFMQTVQAVAQENGSVFNHLSGSTPVAVFPSDEPFSQLWQSMVTEHAPEATVHTFGADSTAKFRYAQVVQTSTGGHRFVLHCPAGQIDIELTVPGQHNIRNAVAACACAAAVGVSLTQMADALRSFGAVKGRMHMHRLTDQVTLIDDTYNANPDSVRAAIDVLVNLPTPRVLVLGDMGEVGNHSAAMHAEVGDYAKQAGVNHLLTMGQDTEHAAQAFGSHAKRCATVDQVCSELLTLTPRSILVKGSRFMKMETVVHQMMSCFPSHAPNAPRTEVQRAV